MTGLLTDRESGHGGNLRAAARDSALESRTTMKAIGRIVGILADDLRTNRGY